MATTPLPLDRQSRRLATVTEHIRCENAHDLTSLMQTFGDAARYDDEPWDQHYEGRDQVRYFYSQIMSALPDLRIEVVRQHVSNDAIILEVIIHGTHLGAWRGMPPTGRHIDLPLCGIYTFDHDDRLAGEKIYYDRATVLRQMGVFHEPETALGTVSTLLTHPVTVTKALARKIIGS